MPRSSAPSDAIRIGTAGWSIPRAVADRFPAEGSGLERYAARFPAAEINSSFYRPHRRATYERWAASVPAGFRFAVKLPKAITHERRLVACADLLDRFADETAGLAEKRGPILVQLPPSFAFAANLAEAFFPELQRIVGGPIALEPRHASWFTTEVDRLLARLTVARVAADPARHPGAGEPGGHDGLAYFRLHGSPHVYRSPYDPPAIDAQAEAVMALAAGGRAVWTIYDNTTSGAAIANALDLVRRLET